MKKILISLILFFVFSLGLKSQNLWEQLSGPYGGLIHTIVSAPNGNLFAFSFNGIYRSANGGLNWVLITAPSLKNFTTGCAAPNGYIYAATGNFTSKIYRSTDNGATWEERLSDGGYEFNDMTVTPSGTVLAGTYYVFSFHGQTTQGGDIYRSTNNGATFALSAFGDLAVGAIKTNINGDLYVATLNGLYKSTNGGAFWDLIRIDTCGRVFTSSAGHIYYSARGGVFRSTDNGGSFQQVSSRLPLASTPNGFLYSAAGGKILRSTDMGESWFEIATISDTPLFSVYSIFNIGNNTLFTGSDIGVHKSVDGGFVWGESNNGIRTSDVKTVAANGNNIFAGTNRSISRSTDNGVTWKNLTGGLPTGDVLNIKFSPNGSLFSFIRGLGLYRSDDNGDHWTELTSLPDSANTGLIAFNSNSNVFVAGFRNVYKSTNNGLTWFPINSGLPVENLLITGISADFQNNLFVSANFGIAGLFHGLFKAANGDTSWSQLNSQNIKADFKYTSNGDIYSISATHLMRSTNGGTSFQIVSSAPDYCIELEIGSQDQIFLHYVFNEIYGIKKSTDLGVTWNEFSQGLGQLLVYDFEFDPGNFLIAATESGLFRTINSTVGITLQNSEIPENYSLSQNYPNPFNPETKIIFSVPENNYIKLRVFNSLGQEIAVLVNGFHKPGTYAVTWDASSYSSGIYFYRLETGNFSSVKKMVFIK